MASVPDIVDAVRGLARGVRGGINAASSFIEDGSTLLSSGLSWNPVTKMDNLSKSFHEKLTETTNRDLRDQFLKYPFDLGSNREYTNVVRFSIHDTDVAAFSGSSMPTAVQMLLVKTTSTTKSAALSMGFSEDASNAIASVVGDSFEAGTQILNQIKQASEYDSTAATDPRGAGLQRARVGLNRNTKSQPNEVIYLYCPPEIKVNYGHGYESTDFSSMNALMLPTNTNNPDSLSAYAKYMGMSNVKSLAGTIPGMFRPEEAAFRGYVEGATKSIINPLLVNRFTGTDRRTFAFEYVFYPKSTSEVQSCYDIIRAFKRYSHPTRASDDRFLSYPAEFWIEVLDGETLERNPFYPGIVWCCLKKVGVSYGEAVTQASLKPAREDIAKAWGSPPTKIMLSLEFEELEILTRNRIDADGGNC